MSKVPVVPFSEPFVLAVEGAAIPASHGGFLVMRTIEQDSGHLLSSIGRSGTAGLQWVVDHDGQFFEFTSLGLTPPTLMQRIGLLSRRERYRIEPARSITVGEFQELAKSLKDNYREAPFSRFLRSTLKKFDPARVVDTEVMIAIMGE